MALIPRTKRGLSASIRRKMEGSVQVASNDIANQYIELETSMMEELDRLSPRSPFRCIFRVPVQLRRVRVEAYTPRVISIGPLHHENEALKAMEEHKKGYLKYFLRRPNNLSLKECIKKIKDQEAKLRSYYSETFELKSDEFVRIILVDAIFIVEYLFRCQYPKLLDENDCIFGKPRMRRDIWSDLLMLENQLPFFILKDLYKPGIFHVPSILFLFRAFLCASDSRPFRGMLDNLETIYYSQVEVQHFVDLLRKLWIAPIYKEQFAGQSKLITTPSIEELHLAGVEFKEGSTKNLFDIQFKDGILEIPKLEITDSTELILRNLVAFEQCAFEKEYISEYVVIMDTFVNTPTDVQLLVKYRIIENCLGGGDNELSAMINSLAIGVEWVSKNFYYSSLCEELKNFCDSKWHKSIANLRQNYFNTPWATISFVAAVVLLILTVVQTICSIIALS